MTNAVTWIEYPSVGAMADALARALHHASARAIAGRGQAWLALAGGKTPFPAYRAFAATGLPWPRVQAVPTDERCVPRGHPASNHGALLAAFDRAPGIVLHPLAGAGDDCNASLEQARLLLAAHPEPFDAVLLGMGADAHFASLFPGAPNLAEALDPAGAADVARIDPAPLPADAPFPRISLTLPRLLRARELHLVVAGAGKRAVLEEAAASGDPLRRPVAALLHASAARLSLHWVA